MASAAQEVQANTDADLMANADALRGTKLFVGPSQAHTLHDKQLIFLVLVDLKPLAEVASGHWDLTGPVRRTRPDDPDKVRAFLVGLGLASSVRLTDHATVALVARTMGVIQRYEAADSNPAVVGEAFGFPATAAEAFARHALLSEAEQTSLIAAHGLTIASPFRLSRVHAAEELEILATWQRALADYDLLG